MSKAKPELVTLAKLEERHAQERRRLILSRLVREGWNVSAAAASLGISESGLRKLVTTYDLDQYRPAPAKRGRPKSTGAPHASR